MTVPTLLDSWAQVQTITVVRSEQEDPTPGELVDRQQLGTPVAAAYHARSAVQIAVGRRKSRILWAGAADKIDPRSLFVDCEARQVSGGKLRSILGGLAWVSVPLSVHDSQDERGLPLPDLEMLATSFPHDHCWVLEALPLHAESDASIQNLERQISVGDRAGGFRSRQKGERAERILDYLALRGHGGLWRATLHCGSLDAAGARALQSAVLESGAFGRLPVSISSSQDEPIPLTSECVGALGRSPVTELPGIRLRHSPRWDLNPEVKGPIRVGAVLDPNREQLRDLSVSRSTMNRHVFVSGATGSGKSETVRRLLEELVRESIPWMVIEPAKAEYHKMAGLIGPENVTLIRLGSGTQAVTLNPLEPTSTGSGPQRTTFPLGTHIAMIRELFAASFDIEDPFPQILSLALERCYEALGWDTTTGEHLGISSHTRTYPTLTALRSQALAVVDELGYGREVSDNVRAAVDVRINSLRNGSAGRFFEAGHPVDLDDLFQRNVVLQIEDLGNERDQAFLIGAVLIRWSELLRLRGDSGGELRHVMVIEEAHRLLRATEDNRAAAIEQFANLLAEVRSYGQGIVVAEQIPSKLISDVIKNSALKIMHRLPSLDDREAVGATMNLDEPQSEAVVALPPGIAAVHADGMDRPVLVAVPAPPGSKRAKLQQPRTGVRSMSCSSSCRDGKRCSQRDLGVSARLAADDAFRLWVDLAVMATVVGERPVEVATAHVTRWKRLALSRSQLRCALGLSIDVSVTARTIEMLPFYDPATMAKELADELNGALMGKEFLCDPQWQLAEFRWVDLERTLTARVRHDQAATGLVTEELAKRGLSLRETTAAGQLKEIGALHEGQRSDFIAKVYGRPSVVAEVARAKRKDPDALLRWLGSSDDWTRSLLGLEARDAEGE